MPHPLPWLVLLGLLALPGCFISEVRQPPPSPAPDAPVLEKISIAELIGSTRYLQSGISLSASRDQLGEVRATMQAGGQVKEVRVPANADFYGLSHRPDVLVMHDRFSRLADTIRVFRFAPAAVRQATFGHGPHAAGYLVRQYRDFQFDGRQLTVVEELTGGAAPATRRFSIPLD